LCLVLTIALMSCAGSRTSESTGQYIDDSTITTKVKTDLLADEGLKGLDIKVVTFKGVVQLSGFVNSESQKFEAEQIAQNVKGVKRVEDKLTVKGTQ
jgi:hyperosmotically inducible periplasmic protein